MTRDARDGAEDIAAVFAAFGVSRFPYRTFPGPPAAEDRAAASDGRDPRPDPWPVAQGARGADAPGRKRDRLRADVHRPTNPDHRRGGRAAL